MTVDKQFKINEYLTLKLENGKTNIYINNELFNQCKFILLEIPKNEINSFDEIESIDEVVERLDRSLEGYRRDSSEILPETEFWAHCSNLQVWAENNYDTRLLHSNLAFPTLKKLTDSGDNQAKQVFKEEIAKRFTSSYIPASIYLLENDYLEYLNKEELDSLIDESTFEKILNTLKGYPFDVRVLENDYLEYLNKEELDSLIDENTFEKILNTLKGYPFDVRVLENISILYDKIGNRKKAINAYNKALESCQHALEMNPKHFRNILYTISFIQLQKNDYENAIKSIRQILDFDPDDSNAWNNLGRAYKRKGDYEMAKEMYKRSLEIDPTNHYAWSNLSELYNMEGNYEKSLEMARNALDMSVYNYEAWFFAGQALYEKKKYDIAINFFKKALKLDYSKKKNYTLKDIRVWIMLCKAYFKNGNYHKALEACIRILAIDPNYREALKMKEKVSKKMD